jgi:translation initiation factor IF-2
MAETTYRISKVASELNVSFTTLVDKLSDKGFSVESKPTTKITEEMYQLLLSEFKSDKAAKDESKSLKISIPKTLKGASGQDKLIKSTEKTTPPTPPPSESEEEENDQIFVKDKLLKTPQANEVVTEKLPSEVNMAPSITNNDDHNDQQVIRPEVVKPRILGKIDLDSLGKGKKSPKVTEEKTPSEKELEVSEKVDVKIPDSTPAPLEKEKDTHISPPQQEEILETVDKKLDASPNETPVFSDTSEFVEVTDTTDKDRPSTIIEVPESETPPPTEQIAEGSPEKGVETIVTQFETLRGLKIKGKIELKTDDPSSNAKNKILKEYAQEKKKKKRTRKVVEKVKIEDAIKDKKPAPQGQKPLKTDRNHKGPITDKEVQDRLKKTLSRIDSSGRGKTNKSKMKRMRREMNETDRMREQALHEMEDRVLKVTEFLSASELAALMDVSVNDIITTCFNLGLMVSINQRLDAETITIVADEFGFDVNFVDADAQVNIKDEEDDPNDLEHRAPIVTVMGHVDHGKTSLLDHIRSANVIAGEAGGITQHIGAYEVVLDDGQKITFLDTPGHEAFTAMRARGAKVTDIAVIVIAADDSVMPQTREAISHAQAANVPMIFAINKIDKPGANPEKIKEELSQMNILVEDWGGKFQCQEIAAKLGKNIDKLLEKILLEAELLELKANPNRKAKGTVIEAKLDKGRGIIASMLVQTGSLSVGDHVVAGAYYGKVKALFNERSSRIDVAGPSTPIGMLGFSGAPTAGDPFLVFETEAEAKELAAKRYQLLREQGIRSTKHITLDEIGRRLAVGNFKELNLIVKGDVDGSVEALSDSLLKLSTEEIQIKVIHKGVGQITESDVLLASASDAIIIGFQVRPAASAKKIAEAEQIDIRTYSIIYKAIDEVKAAVEGMLSPELVEKITGNAEVRETFSISKVGTIAGCMVLDGKASRGSQLRIVRDGVVIHTGKLLSLKRFKDDVKEVLKGYECGLQVEKFNDLHVGDILEFFTEDEVKRKLK